MGIIVVLGVLSSAAMFIIAVLIIAKILVWIREDGVTAADVFLIFMSMLLLVGTVFNAYYMYVYADVIAALSRM